MNKIFLLLFSLVLLATACDQKKGKRTYKTAALAKKKVGPTYEKLYLSDSVELEKIQFNGEIDQYIAIKLIVNSSKELKASYLNYSMDTYKSIEPPESKLEPLFDAEHIGKFIVWQYVNDETDCLRPVLSMVARVLRAGDEETKSQVVRYGILQMIILESRALNVNYNVAFKPFLNGTGKEFYDLLDEMETGRS